MRSVRRALGSVSWGTALLLFAAAGCSQGVDVEPSGGGASEPSDGPDAGSSNRRDSGRGPSQSGDDDDDAPVVITPSGDKDCNRINIVFGSPEPTVYILVDRSSSMFEQNFWDPLKAGVLKVVERLEKQVNFGFGTYTGQAGGKCPDVTGIDRVAKNNYMAIKTAYDALGKPSYKGETPTAAAVDAVANQLAADRAGAADVAMSPTVILLVTDGEPDFCDDPNVTCSRDAVVGAVQGAKQKGIGTFIFSIGGQVDRNHLGDVANAGTGQPVADRNNAVMYQCPMKRATYSATSGNAPFFEPNVNDQSALVSAIEGVVSSVRSCVFDLQGSFKIDLAQAGDGTVELDGQRVPYNAPDGYRMNSPTQLELTGTACEKLRKPEAKRVLIDFPCEAVLVI